MRALLVLGSFVLVGLAASASGFPFQCLANAGVPPSIRANGLTELAGDLTLNCTGGTPTPAGQAFPQFNFTVLLNTNVTGRITGQSEFSEALLFVDEPALCLEATADAVSEERRLSALAVTLEGARKRGAIAGLHCCAARPFRRMCRAKPDILSFDAHEGLELFFADGDARDFVKQGGAVAYGLIPTWPGLDGVNPAGIFSRWLKAAALAGDPQELARRAMITATCGLGLLEPGSIAPSFSAAHEVGKLIHTLADTPAVFGALLAGS